MDKTGFPPFRGTRTKWGPMCHIGGGIPRVSITRPKEAHRTVCNKEYVVNPSRFFVLESDLERWFGTTGICAMWLFVIIEMPLSYRRD